MNEKLILKKRENLAESIPLATPFTLRIDPASLCSLACIFCPTGDKNLLRQFNRYQGIMEYELSKKIIDDLKAFKAKLKKLYFYKEGEPLLNPRLVDMIKYAKDNEVAEEIWIYTNGTLLNPGINRRLVNAGLDIIWISIYGVCDQDYYKISNRRLDYKKLTDNIADLYKNRGSCQIHVKLLDCNFNNDKKTKFMGDFKNISTTATIENLHGWSMSNIKDFTLKTNPTTTPEGLPFVPKEICPYPFYTLTVNFNGTVSICCVDWSHSTIVGDLRRQSLYDVWTGKELLEFRTMHLKKERYRNPACRNCQYILDTFDCIDSQAQEILEKLSCLT